MKFQKFNTIKFGLALGLMSAIAFFILGIVAISGYGAIIVEKISSIYIGYSASVGGAILGALWAFVDGFVGGIIFAWVYNKIL